MVNEVKWIACHGTGPGVPIFLRGMGKVRNRNLAKVNVEQIITDFWAAKVLRDSRPRAPRVTVEEYFPQWFKTTHGADRLCVEMAYNTVYALRRLYGFCGANDYALKFALGMGCLASESCSALAAFLHVLTSS
eukprot:SAG11_NODE_159_length_14027_cov_6.893667_9_plen_133_part_00